MFAFQYTYPMLFVFYTYLPYRWFWVLYIILLHGIDYRYRRILWKLWLEDNIESESSYKCICFPSSVGKAEAHVMHSVRLHWELSNTKYTFSGILAFDIDGWGFFLECFFFIFLNKYLILIFDAKICGQLFSPKYRAYVQ